MATTTIKSPFGVADQFVLAAAVNTSLTVANMHTVIDGATIPLTAAVTLNLTVDSRLPIGSKMYIKINTVGATTVTFGTGFTVPLFTGVAGKTFTIAMYYDGSKYLPTAAPYQIN